MSLGGRSPHELVYSRGVSTQLPESANNVPERFHQGRESLSVTRNITVRESKRPKARSQDQDYQRRSSFSPSIRPSLGQQFPLRSSGMDHRLQVGGGDGVRHEATPLQNMNCTPPTPVSRSASVSNPPRSPGAFSETGAGIPGNDRFEINLTFEGRAVRHEVSADMRVSYLKTTQQQFFTWMLGT